MVSESPKRSRYLSLCTRMVIVILTTIVFWLLLRPPTPQDPSALTGQSIRVHSTTHTNHVFNSINSALKTWGSAVHYDRGLTAFMASMPPGARLYHGTSSTDPVAGIQWFALEPEHAVLFAKPSRTFQTHVETPKVLQDIQSSVPQAFSLPGPGYLQTYITIQSLRLLYFDGMSAAKANKRTLDLQDRVVLRRESNTSTSGPSDARRVADLCRMVKRDWSNKIDGFIRMETGFEVILCTTSKVRLQDNVKTGVVKDLFATYQAISERFDDVGPTRVTLDYENMVTFFAFPDAEVLDTHGQFVGLDNATPNQIAAMRSQIDRLVLDKSRAKLSTNWQDVTNYIVGRYATRLTRLAFDTFDDKLALDTELLQALGPFVDIDTQTNTTIHQCTRRYLPTTPSATLASFAIRDVSRRICTALFYAYDEDTTVALAQFRIASLVRWLDWPVWMKCVGCKANEVCYTPVWPISRVLGHRDPVCLDEAGFIALFVGTV